ncbi:MAG: HU family DNA-binding protein [Clostridia bacterium]|nr:HU family DNA-binding protein [Clostridia bacterium]
MTKSDLVSVVATKTDLKKKDVEVAVNATIEAIIEGLKAGDKIQISGFGAYEVKDVAEHQGRNPATGETITVPASKKVTFSPAKAMKDAVNND